MDFRHNAARRRRVMRDERLEVENLVSETSTTQPFRRYLTEDVLAAQPTVLHCLPTHRWWVMALIACSLTIATALVVFGQSSAAETMPWPMLADNPQWWALQHPGSLGNLFLIALGFGNFMLGFQILHLRRHRNDDYHGTYQVWVWTLPLLGILALANFDSLVGILGLCLSAAAALDSIPSWPALLSILATLLIFGITIRGYGELRENWSSKVFLLCAAVCGSIYVGTRWNEHARGWPEVADWPLMSSSHWWLATTTVINACLLSYLCFVHRDVRGLIVRSPALDALSPEDHSPATTGADPPKPEMLERTAKVTGPEKSHEILPTEELTHESDSNILTRRKRRKAA